MPPTYREVYDRWRSAPEAFWAEAAEAVHWYRRWDAVLDSSRAPFYRWFPGAETNSCYNALDRHVEGGRADQVALIYDSPVTSTVRTYTYRELRDEVARFAGVLAAKGVGRGDRVVIYMPMVPETVIGMLACARIGAVHSVVFGGFASAELASRLTDARPKAVLTASCGIEVNRVVPYKPMLDEAIELAVATPDCCIVLQRPEAKATLMPGRDHDWRELAAGARPVDCVPVLATDPLYILYTSGTTGNPKGIIRDNGGHMVGLTWSMRNIYGVEPGEVYWAASDVGWVVGHSYIVYGPLFYGNTTVLYEGKPVGTPDAGAFCRVITQHGVRAFFTAPTAFRAIKRDDPEGEHIRRYDRSSSAPCSWPGALRSADPRVGRAPLGVPVIDHWWQTETGWPVGSNCPGWALPVKPGSCARACAGLGCAGAGRLSREVAPGEHGNVVISSRSRRAPRRHCGTTTRASERPISTPTPATTSRPMPAKGRGRLPLDHGPHRRRDQRRRAPALHRPDGGGAGGAPGHRRVRCGGRGRRAQGRGAARPRGAQGRDGP